MRRKRFALSLKVAFALTIGLLAQGTLGAEKPFGDRRTYTGQFFDSLNETQDSITEHLSRLGRVPDSDAVNLAPLENDYNEWRSLVQSGRGVVARSGQFFHGRFIDPLYNNITDYFYSANQPHEAEQYIRDAMEIAGEDFHYARVIKYAGMLADLYVGAGNQEKCFNVHGIAKTQFDDTVGWMDLENVEPNQQLKALFMGLQVDDIRLRCELLSERFDDDAKARWNAHLDYMFRQYDKHILLKMLSEQHALSSDITLRDSNAVKYSATNPQFLERMLDYYLLLGDGARAERVYTRLDDWYMRTVTLDPGNPTANRIFRSNAADRSSEAGRRAAQSSLVRTQKMFKLKRHVYGMKTALLQSNYKSAEAHLKQFEAAVSDAQKTYDSLDPFIGQQDRLNNLLYTGYFTAARVFEETVQTQSGLAEREKLARYRQAEERIGIAIELAEQWRLSLPVEERQYFFRSQARKTYLLAYRIAAQKLDMRPESVDYFSGFIAAGEKLRSRQLRELLAGDSHNRTPDTTYSKDLAGDGNAYLIVSDLDSELWSVAFNQSQVSLYHTEKPADWSGKVSTLRHELASNSPLSEKILVELDELVGAQAEILKSAARVNVVVDGSLSQIPLGIARFEGVNLGLAKSLLYRTSISRTSVADEDSGNALGAMLALADPVFPDSAPLVDQAYLSAERQRSVQGYFTALPETRDEVIAIETALGIQADKLLGPDATKQNFLKRVNEGDYGVLHFATHGVLGGELPGLTEPALVLGGDDALLTASEIQNLNLGADLVVLSACNTGSGEYYFGESLAGMGRAFALAGAKYVVVSLWPVDSESTKNMMIALYEQVARGHTIDEAMVLAMQTTSARGNSMLAANRGVSVAPSTAPREGYEHHPYYWAPFIVMKID